MSRRKKKRNKKYRPAEGGIPQQPFIHRFVAEAEERKQGQKRWRRRAALGGGLLFILLLLGWLLF